LVSAIMSYSLSPVRGAFPRTIALLNGTPLIGHYRKHNPFFQ